MTHTEFLSWAEFYRLFPFDDLHRFHRPAALIATAMGGGDLQPTIDWLQPPPENRDLNDADVITLRAFGFNRKAG